MKRIRRAGLYTLLAIAIWIVTSVAISVGGALSKGDIEDPGSLVDLPTTDLR